MTTTSGTMRTEPAIEGWFTEEGGPALLGTRCEDCGTVYFPRVEGLCRNPGCFGRSLLEHRISGRGRVWSYTNACYQPPAPYVPPGEEHEPFCHVAVELEDEAMIVMGQVVAGIGIEDLEVGLPVRLVIDTLFVDEQAEGGPVRKTVWKFEPAYGEGLMTGDESGGAGDA